MSERLCQACGHGDRLHRNDGRTDSDFTTCVWRGCPCERFTTEATAVNCLISADEKDGRAYSTFSTIEGRRRSRTNMSLDEVLAKYGWPRKGLTGIHTDCWRYGNELQDEIKVYRKIIRDDEERMIRVDEMICDVIAGYVTVSPPTDEVREALLKIVEFIRDEELPR